MFFEKKELSLGGSSLKRSDILGKDVFAGNQKQEKRSFKIKISVLRKKDSRSFSKATTRDYQPGLKERENRCEKRAGLKEIFFL